MKDVITTVYSFDELSEEAQENALNQELQFTIESQHVSDSATEYIEDLVHSETGIDVTDKISWNCNYWNTVTQFDIDTPGFSEDQEREYATRLNDYLEDQMSEDTLRENIRLNGLEYTADGQLF